MFAVACLGLALLPPSGCKKDLDLSRLQGTWREVDSGKKFDLDDQGNGFGPYGGTGSGCGRPPTDQPGFKSSFPCDVGTSCYPFMLDAAKAISTSRVISLCAKPCSGTRCDDGFHCGSTATHEGACVPDLPIPLHSLHTTTNAFGEYLIAYGDDAADNANLIPCGPCTLDDSGVHLSCKVHTKNGGLSSCEFDRVGGTPTDSDAAFSGLDSSGP